ncbi:hypothetical protein HDV05_003101 [Chytridiales sp. JEL 0842]|nr:hypothetical protein HDV05_003101 [Chytridiales sp. JEL 0842]
MSTRKLLKSSMMTEDDINICHSILNGLKRHESAGPFLLEFKAEDWTTPKTPIDTSVLESLVPMNLSIIEQRLNQTGPYASTPSATLAAAVSLSSLASSIPSSTSTSSATSSSSKQSTTSSSLSKQSPTSPTSSSAPSSYEPYTSPQEFIADILTIFKNVQALWKPQDPIWKMGEKLQAFLEWQVGKIGANRQHLFEFEKVLVASTSRRQSSVTSSLASPSRQQSASNLKSDETGKPTLAPSQIASTTTASRPPKSSSPRRTSSIPVPSPPPAAASQAPDSDDDFETEYPKLSSSKNRKPPTLTISTSSDNASTGAASSASASTSAGGFTSPKRRGRPRKSTTNIEIKAPEAVETPQNPTPNSSTDHLTRPDSAITAMAIDQPPPFVVVNSTPPVVGEVSPTPEAEDEEEEVPHPRRSARGRTRTLTSTAVLTSDPIVTSDEPSQHTPEEPIADTATTPNVSEMDDVHTCLVSESTVVPPKRSRGRPSKRRSSIAGLGSTEAEAMVVDDAETEAMGGVCDGQGEKTPAVVMEEKFGREEGGVERDGVDGVLEAASAAPAAEVEAMRVSAPVAEESKLDEMKMEIDVVGDTDTVMMDVVEPEVSVPIEGEFTFLLNQMGNLSNLYLPLWVVMQPEKDDQSVGSEPTQISSTPALAFPPVEVVAQEPKPGPKPEPAKTVRTGSASRRTSLPSASGPEKPPKKSRRTSTGGSSSSGNSISASKDGKQQMDLFKFFSSASSSNKNEKVEPPVMEPTDSSVSEQQTQEVTESAAGIRLQPPPTEAESVQELSAMQEMSGGQKLLRSSMEVVTVTAATEPAEPSSAPTVTPPAPAEAVEKNPPLQPLRIKLNLSRPPKPLEADEEAEQTRMSGSDFSSASSSDMEFELPKRSRRENKDKSKKKKNKRRRRRSTLDDNGGGTPMFVDEEEITDLVSVKHLADNLTGNRTLTDNKAAAQYKQLTLSQSIFKNSQPQLPNNNNTTDLAPAVDTSSYSLLTSPRHRTAFLVSTLADVPTELLPEVAKGLRKVLVPARNLPSTQGGNRRRSGASNINWGGEDEGGIDVEVDVGQLSVRDWEGVCGVLVGVTSRNG